MNAMRGGLGVLPLSWAETCPEPRRATHPICTGDPAPYTSPDTSIRMTAMRLRMSCVMRSTSICSISAAVLGRLRPPGGAGMGLGRLSPNQKTP